MNTRDLYEFTNEDQFPLGLPVLAALTGFTDAGGTTSQVTESIFAHLDASQFVRFSNDALLDYRSRRPVMFFERDHISSYEPPILALDLVHDEAGQSFWFLHGYEPDFAWESFAQALMELFDTLSVSQLVWVHSIPFPVPHTRPLGITVSGSRKDLIDRYSEWKPETQVPGNVLHLIEYCSSQREIPTTGFVLLVPHYIADSEYPQVAVTAFELISAAMSRVFPTDELREQNRKFVNKLDAQVPENPELSRLIEQLEQGYSSGRLSPIRAQVQPNEAIIPSADDIASDIEDYLAARRRNISEDEEN